MVPFPQAKKGGSHLLSDENKEAAFNFFIGLGEPTCKAPLLKFFLLIFYLSY